MTFTYDAASHVYAVDGRPIVGVSDALTPLRGPAAAYYTDATRDRGRRVHLACMAVDLDVESEHTDDIEIRPYADSYQFWRASMIARWSHVEEPYYSRTYDFAGCADRVGTVNHRPAIVDFKTGGPADWHAHQTALYDLLYDDIPPRLRRRLTIYLRADGRAPRTVEHTNAFDYNHALSLLRRAHVMRRFDD